MKSFPGVLLSFLIAALATVNSSVAAEPPGGSNGTVEWRQVAQAELPGSPVDIVHSLDGKYAYILTADGQILVYDQEGKIAGKIDAGKGVTAMDIDPRGEYLYLADGKNNQFKTLVIDFVVKLDTGYAPYKGKINAPVTIAVFSDFQ
jgi:DNA-binding beta-propeller fold protein YncE